MRGAVWAGPNEGGGLGGGGVRGLGGFFLAPRFRFRSEGHQERPGAPGTLLAENFLDTNLRSWDFASGGAVLGAGAVLHPDVEVLERERWPTARENLSDF